MAHTLKDMREFGSMTETRFSDAGTTLYIHNQDRGLWRYVVCEIDGMCACVGPQFKTKMEAMAEAKDYAKQYFGDIF